MKKSKQIFAKWFNVAAIPVLIAFALDMSSCTNPTQDAGSKTTPLNNAWVLDTTIYQLYVKSYYDSDNNDIGDLRGVIEKFDYLKELGIETIWLMPVFEADDYHGYNTNDYYKIRNDYGTTQDLKNLATLAHDNDMKIILDLVVNHTGIHNDFFKDHTDWYCWEEPSQNHEKDTTWRDISYWQKPWGGGSVSEKDSLFGRGNFYAVFGWDMPDLNWKNPEVVDEVKKIMTYWINETGVDGYRCDAARYLQEEGNGKQKDLASTHNNWKNLRSHLKSVKPSAILLAEAPTETYEQMRGYYGNGDEFDTAFHFNLQYLLMDTLKKESRPGGLMQGIYDVQSYLPSGTQDTIFLSNHDQFAGDRVATQLGNNVGKMKSVASLYLLLSGNPAIYYGEEIGMQGGGSDPELRKQLEWNTIDQMKNDDDSLLNHYKRLLRLREFYKATAGGISYFTSTKSNGDWDNMHSNSSTLSIIREYYGEKILIVHNFKSQAMNLSVNLAASGLTIADGTEVHSLMGGGSYPAINSSNISEYSIGSVGGYHTKVFFLGKIDSRKVNDQFMTYENALDFGRDDVFSISGQITENENGLSDVSVSAGGKTSKTDGNGNYTISGLANGTYTVSVSKGGYDFNPSSRTVIISDANITGLNFSATMRTKKGLVIHFFKPSAWTNSAVKIHYWNTNSSEDPDTVWPGDTMIAEGNGWYVFQFNAATSTNIVFNNDVSPQTKDLSRSGAENSHHYYKDGQWTNEAMLTQSAGQITENERGVSDVAVSLGVFSGATDGSDNDTIPGCFSIHDLEGYDGDYQMTYGTYFTARGGGNRWNVFPIRFRATAKSSGEFIDLIDPDAIPA